MNSPLISVRAGIGPVLMPRVNPGHEDRIPVPGIGLTAAWLQPDPFSRSGRILATQRMLPEPFPLILNLT